MAVVNIDHDTYPNTVHRSNFLSACEIFVFVRNAQNFISSVYLINPDKETLRNLKLFVAELFVLIDLCTISKKER